MRKIYLLLYLGAFIFTSCAPKISTQITKSYPPLEKEEEVIILSISDKMPSNANILANLKIGDSGLTIKCDYDYLIDHAKAEARKIGGNIVKLTSHQLPSILTSCHTIEGLILKTNPLEVVAVKSDSINANTVVAVIEKPIKKDYQKLRIAVNGGYSYRIAKIANTVPADFKSYVKNLKSGYHVAGDINYFFSDLYGAGVKYSLFRSSNSTNIQETNGPRSGIMSDDISINFIGPAFTTRGINKKGTAELLMSFSIGYVDFYNKSRVIDPIIITGNTIGAGVDIGYDMKLSKKLSLGLQASYIIGKLTKITRDNGTTKETIKFENNEGEGLNRFDISAGLRLNL